MLAPHEEACDALVAHFDPALILPTDAGGWALQDGVKVSPRHNTRESLTDWAWYCAAWTTSGRAPAQTGANARTAAKALEKALAALEQHLEPYTPAPYAQQLAAAEHERKIAALTFPA